MLRFKTCSDCREYLANNLFYAKPSGAKDGLDNKCKKCRINHNRAYSAESRRFKTNLYLAAGSDQ